MNKEGGLSRVSPFSHSAATILVKLYQKYITSDIKKRGWGKEKIYIYSSVWFNSINIYKHILVCYFNITHQYFKLPWLLFFFSHPSGKIPTSVEPPVCLRYACNRTALFLFICTSKTVSLSIRKYSLICNYTFISVLKDAIKCVFSL